MNYEEIRGKAKPEELAELTRMASMMGEGREQMTLNKNGKVYTTMRMGRSVPIIGKVEYLLEDDGFASIIIKILDTKTNA